MFIAISISVLAGLGLGVWAGYSARSSQIASIAAEVRDAEQRGILEVRAFAARIKKRFS